MRIFQWAFPERNNHSLHLPAVRKWKEPASEHTCGSRAPHFWYTQQRMSPGTCATALPAAALQMWMFSTSTKQIKPLCWSRALRFYGAVLYSTWAALHRSSLSDFKLSFPSEDSRRDGGVFKAAQISLFHDIPAWEFLKVRDLRFSLIFKAKPIRNGCLLDCLHTPTAGLEKIFLWWKNLHMFQKFCWPKFSRITSILNVFIGWNTSSLLPPPVFPTKVFLKLSNWWFSEYLLGVKSFFNVRLYIYIFQSERSV